jgi:hypothetical protein
VRRRSGVAIQGPVQAALDGHAPAGLAMTGKRRKFVPQDSNLNSTITNQAKSDKSITE